MAEEHLTEFVYSVMMKTNQSDLESGNELAEKALDVINSDLVEKYPADSMISKIAFLIVTASLLKSLVKSLQEMETTANDETNG